jgi:hypothetical protein
VSQRVRRLQVHEVGDRHQSCIESLRREHHGKRGLGVDHGVPGSSRVKPGEHHVRIADQELGQRRVELLAGAPPCQLSRRRNATDSMSNLGELRPASSANRNPIRHWRGTCSIG